MEIFRTRKEVRDHIKKWREGGGILGLVPTMGALHAGHISLIDAARKQTDLVVCSIFVNPTQFGDPDDLKSYPRPVDEDIKKLKASGCHILFMPDVEEMYGAHEQWHIDLDGFDSVLEGAVRPGHYQGVTQVVYKLFDIIGPDYAYFGQKDFQQFMVIRYMVQLLNIPVRLVRCPIVRENDGLAMSSRNVHLKTDERPRATALYQALMDAKSNFGKLPLTAVRDKALDFLRGAEGIEPDYFELYDADSFVPAVAGTGHVIALTAARLGSIRIIDNMFLSDEQN